MLRHLHATKSGFWRALRHAAALSGVSGALLAGCAPTPLQLEPAARPTGPTARLLLRGAVPPGDRFAVVQLTDALMCQGPRMLIAGMPQKLPDPGALAAGVLTTLDFVILRGGKPSCGVRWTFTPEAGKTYLVQGMQMGAGCSARLLDASVADRPQPPPDAVLRTAPGQVCLPLDKARSAASDTLLQGGQQGADAVLNPKATDADLQGLIRR
jgi:hypothetical protein